VTPHDTVLFVFERLRGVETKGELGRAIASEVLCYTLHDLQGMRGVLEADLRHLPSQYRRRLLPRMREQIFGAHHRLLVMARNGSFSRMTEPLREGWPDYCKRAEEVCRGDGVPGGDPAHAILYFLLSGFVMFVLEEPGHPVKTPFPGGFEVEKRDGVYYCPVRDKVEEVRVSICPWCPAVQTPGV